MGIIYAYKHMFYNLTENQMIELIKAQDPDFVATYERTVQNLKVTPVRRPEIKTEDTVQPSKKISDTLKLEMREQKKQNAAAWRVSNRSLIKEFRVIRRAQKKQARLEKRETNKTYQAIARLFKKAESKIRSKVVRKSKSLTKTEIKKADKQNEKVAKALIKAEKKATRTPRGEVLKKDVISKVEHHIFQEETMLRAGAEGQDVVFFENDSDFFDQIVEVIEECSEAVESVPDIMIRGKKQQKKTEAQKKKIKSLKVQEKLDKKFTSSGFEKVYDNSGSFVQYSRVLPQSYQKTFQNVVQMLAKDSFFDVLYGQTGRDNYNLNQDIRTEIKKEKLKLAGAVNGFKNTLSMLSNVTGTYSIQIGEAKITKSTLEELINEVILSLRRYISGEGLKQRNERIGQEVSEIKLNLLISKNQSLKVKGRFMQTVVDSSWFVINPMTKTHCVADCLAILEVFRSDVNLVSLWGYIKRSGEKLADKHNIQEGATNEQLKGLAQKYNVDIVFNVDEDREEWDCDAYLIVQDGHCMIALNPENPRSKIIHDLSERFNHEQIQEMKKWEPNEQKIYLAAFDFEWFVSGENQIPYAFGLIWDAAEKYISHHQVEGIYSAFIDGLFKMADDVYTTKYMPEMMEEFRCEKKLLKAMKIKKNKCVISLFAHNGHKADYPIIEKALLESSLFRLEGQCASGMAKISYTYKVMGKYEGAQLFVQFTDSLNLYKGTLDEFGKAVGLPVEKSHVNHAIISSENYRQQIEEQKIDVYLRRDCDVLYLAMEKYNEQIKQELGFSLLRNNVLTQASMAQKNFYWKFYNGGMYTMPEEMSNFCQRAYKGGLCDTFKTGIFNRVISVDINSSYPYQMIKAPLPTGKPFMQVFNRRYAGEPLLEGDYQIIVVSTPSTLKYPCLSKIINGKQTFARFSNEEMTITKEELFKAHSQGYVIHILQAVVVETTSQPYVEMINEAYQKRQELKRLMKNTTDKAEWARLNIAQECKKVMLNSLYGKLGWSKNHDVSNYVTYNTKFLFEQFALGNITSISKVNENYTAYSGVQVSEASHTNFLIASYITARARLHIIDALEAFDQAGYEPIYTDTDSIYCHITERATDEKFNKHIAPLLHSSRLGGMKLEMKDNVEENEAIGCFVAPKLYALRGPNTGVEKVVARGVLKWMTDSKAASAARRLEEGQEQVTFNEIAGLLEGTPIEITRQQTIIRKELLKSGADNIKVQREMTSMVRGVITKRIVRDDGVCLPMAVDGGMEVPRGEAPQCNWMQFQKIEDAERQFETTFDDLASRYCVLRNQKSNVFIVFLVTSAVPGYLEKHNQANECHQMFGEWMQPAFDIDFVEPEVNVVNTDVSIAVQAIAQALKIEVSELKIVNRSRQTEKGFKHSYHIRAPRYVIQRNELRDLVSKMKNDDMKNIQMCLVSEIDSCIYRSKGQLRISDNSIYYCLELLQISFYSKADQERRQKIKDSAKSKIIDRTTEESIKKGAEEFLKKNKIEGWTFRQAKVMKTATIVNLNRQASAKTFCDICDRHHDKDNTMFLKMTAKKTEVCCMRNRSQ